jgi:hypothetical protein
MEILWSALGIGAVVCAVLYVLAGHWQRVLRQQSWMIRKLAERVKSLEEVSDPQFRQRLDESSPMPLTQVFTFSFRLSEQFWRGTLALTDEDWEFIRRFGSFVGSLKLERWRSHTVATITELLPASATEPWQRRSLDYYPGDGKEDEVLSLWELPLCLPNRPAERPSSVELRLHRNAIELCVDFQASERLSQTNGAPADAEIKVFRVPLDTAQLAEFRSRQPRDAPDQENPDSSSNGSALGAVSWRAFYSATDERVGFEWQLWVRDLTGKAEWDRWKILEPDECAPPGDSTGDRNRKSVHGPGA